jgi:hypothetical protein
LYRQVDRPFRAPTLEHVQATLRRISNTDVTITVLHAGNHMD